MSFANYPHPYLVRKSRNDIHSSVSYYLSGEGASLNYSDAMA